MILDNFLVRIGLCVGLVGWLAMGNLAELSAQSDPAGFDTVINAPPTIIPSNGTIGSNTQLNVFDDEDLPFEVGSGFHAGSPFAAARNTNIEVNLFDGVINFGFVGNSGSTLNILGGLLGVRSQANSGCVINLSGGLITSQFEANSGSEINITGGRVGGSFNANSGSAVNISGGTIGPEFDAFSGSALNISGGNIGGRFEAMPGSNVTFVGGEFLVDGETPSNPASFTLPVDSVLTGTLEDGSVFIFHRDNELFIEDRLSGVTLLSGTLPVNDLTPQIVSSEAGQTIGGLRSGQSLTLLDGGVLNDNFAVVNATLDVLGGEIGSNLRFANSVANISGGTIDGGTLGHTGTNVYAGSTVNISADAELSGTLTAHAGSEVNILGGTMFRVDANRGGILNVSGGSISSAFAMEGGEVLISGGLLGRLIAEAGSLVEITGGSLSLLAQGNSTVTISGGAIGSFEADPGNNVTIRGGEFLLNGIAPANLAEVTLIEPYILSGTLEDGSVFIFSDLPSFYPDLDEMPSVSLETVALPPILLAPIIVDSAQVAPPAGLRAGQSLTLRGDGALARNFAAVDATLNIEGGSVGSNLEIEKSMATISGGEFGSFTAYSGSEVSLSGGELTSLELVESSAEISSDTLLDRLIVFGSSVVDVAGGTIRDDGFTAISVAEGGTLNLSGGTIDGIFTVSSDSQLNLFMTEAFIDGIEIDDLPLNVARTISQREVVLSGTLADGSEFNRLVSALPTAVPRDWFRPGSTVTVTLVSTDPNIVLGDVDGDGVASFLDIGPFIEVLANQSFLEEADTNQDGVVNFLDIAALITILFVTRT